MFFNITRYETEEVSFHMFLKKMTTNYLEKEKFQVSHYEQEEAPAEIVSTSFFIKPLKQLSTVFVLDFRKKTTLKVFRKWKYCF